MKKIILAFTVLLYISCNPSSDKQVNNAPLIWKEDNVSSFIVKTVKLNLDETTPTITYCLQYIDSTSELTFSNYSINALYRYNINTGNVVKKLSLNKEGPNGVGQIYGYGIYTPNQIYVLNYNTSILYEIDSLGAVVRNYKLQQDNFPKPKIITHEPLIIKWPYAIMSSAPYRDYNSTDYYEANDLLTILNLENSEISYSLGYPDNMKNKLWGTNLSNRKHTYNKEKDKIVISYAASSFLVETTLETTKEIDVPSAYISSINPVKSVPKEFKQRHKIHKQNPQYGEIIYDKYKKIYYRAVYQPIPERYLESADSDESMTKPFSIMILDSTYKVIKEIKFPHLQYHSFMSFVTKEGLCIGRFAENEDEMIFDCFDFRIDE